MKNKQENIKKIASEHKYLSKKQGKFEQEMKDMKLEIKAVRKEYDQVWKENLDLKATKEENDFITEYENVRKKKIGAT